MTPLLQVVTRCFQLLTSVFQAPPAVAIPYIRALGPPLLGFLQVPMPTSSNLQSFLMG